MMDYFVLSPLVGHAGKVQKERKRGRPVRAQRSAIMCRVPFLWAAPEWVFGAIGRALPTSNRHRKRIFMLKKPSDAEQPRILIFVFAATKSLAARTRWATQQFICEHLFAAGYHKERPSFW
jgi:hypothetical protein